VWRQTNSYYQEQKYIMWGYMFAVVVYYGNKRGFDARTEQWLEHLLSFVKNHHTNGHGDETGKRMWWQNVINRATLRFGWWNPHKRSDESTRWPSHEDLTENIRRFVDDLEKIDPEVGKLALALGTI